MARSIPTFAHADESADLTTLDWFKSPVLSKTYPKLKKEPSELVSLKAK